MLYSCVRECGMSLATPNVVWEPAVSASLGSLLAMQALRPHSDLFNQNLHFYRYPRWSDWIPCGLRCSLPAIQETRLWSLGQEDPGEGNGNPLQYSCLENPMGGGAWQVTVHRITKSQAWLSDFTFTFRWSVQYIPIWAAWVEAGRG